MNQRAQWLAAVSAGALLIGLWAYRNYGGVIATSDSTNDERMFYRVVVRKIPFSKAPDYEATLLFRGKDRMSSNTLRWDSSKVHRVDIKWNSLNDFTIHFDGTPVRCTFVPWQSAQWSYGAAQ